VCRLTSKQTKAPFSSHLTDKNWRKGLGKIESELPQDIVRRKSSSSLVGLVVGVVVVVVVVVVVGRYIFVEREILSH
jgi:hypothetical protein